VPRGAVVIQRRSVDAETAGAESGVEASHRRRPSDRGLGGDLGSIRFDRFGRGGDGRGRPTGFPFRVGELRRRGRGVRSKNKKR
jgi:hypothetical protein